MSFFLVGLLFIVVATFFLSLYVNDRDVGAALGFGVFVALLWIIGNFSYWGYQAEPKQYACEARGMNYRTRTLSDSTVCIPRYRGADSLNITGVR